MAMDARFVAAVRRAMQATRPQPTSHGDSTRGWVATRYLKFGSEVSKRV
jgi:hypothetical protein